MLILHNWFYFEFSAYINVKLSNKASFLKKKLGVYVLRLNLELNQLQKKYQHIIFELLCKNWKLKNNVSDHRKHFKTNKYI